MPNMNDFYAFKSTSGGGDNGGGGCFGNVLVWLIIIFAIITFIGKMCGAIKGHMLQKVRQTTLSRLFLNSSYLLNDIKICPLGNIIVVFNVIR